MERNGRRGLGLQKEGHKAPKLKLGPGHIFLAPALSRRTPVTPSGSYTGRVELIVAPTPAASGGSHFGGAGLIVVRRKTRRAHNIEFDFGLVILTCKIINSQKRGNNLAAVRRLLVRTASAASHI